MTTAQKVSAFAPASIGNVSVGFDLLGAALAPVDGTKLGDTVELVASEQFGLSVTGQFATKLPADPDANIVAQAYHFYWDAMGLDINKQPAAHMTLHKNLPIGSGLGSSASSIVAALAAINHFYGDLCDQQRLLAMMGELEGKISGSVHYDNVAPAWLGGMTLMVEHQQTIARQLPVFENWYWVVCYSGATVSTSAARNILPTQVPMSTTLTAARNLSVFVDALHRGDESTAAAMLVDVLAEPHRRALLPGFDSAKAFAQSHGGLAFGISGSGPTVFALTDQLQNAQIIHQYLQDHYIQNDNGFSHICKINTLGTQIVKESPCS